MFSYNLNNLNLHLICFLYKKSEICALCKLLADAEFTMVVLHLHLMSRQAEQKAQISTGPAPGHTSRTPSMVCRDVFSHVFAICIFASLICLGPEPGWIMDFPKRIEGPPAPSEVTPIPIIIVNLPKFGDNRNSHSKGDHSSLKITGIPCHWGIQTTTDHVYYGKHELCHFNHPTDLNGNRAGCSPPLKTPEHANLMKINCRTLFYCRVSYHSNTPHNCTTMRALLGGNARPFTQMGKETLLFGKETLLLGKETLLFPKKMGIPMAGGAWL